MNKQIISRKRVVDHGEVFTNEREVKAMLDLVKNETERIESRFLEPACGKGAFLVEVLNRKLTLIKNKDEEEYKKYSILIISSIYGIDILEDNVKDCQNILYNIVETEYKTIFNKEPETNYKETLQFILSKNIIYGDALTLKTTKNKDIIFSEWSLVDNNFIKRRDFSFCSIVNCSTEGMPLFSDKGEDVWLPRPIKEFPLTNYLEVKNAES